MIISSVDNKKIKEVKKLRVNKFSNEEKKFIVEGRHLVEEAYKTGLLVETFSVCNETCYNVSNTVVTSNVMKVLSNLPSIPDVIGVCNFIPEKDELGDKVLILDGVQDPGNLGTIIRSACAFGFTTMVLSPDTVKKYNDKVIRASQGMLFKVNVVTRKLDSFIEELFSLNYHVYKTDVTGGKRIGEINDKGPVAIVMGNEGTGVSNAVKELVKESIYIGMNEACESLNVAVAASIIMYELGVK